MLRPIIVFFLELGVWFGSALAFLGVYSDQHYHSFASFWHHLMILSWVWIFFVLVRMLLWHLLPGKQWPRWLGSAIGATLFLGLMSYYALVIMGLNSWGQIISWQLIITYAEQWQELALSQGVSPVFVVGCVTGALVLFTFAIAVGPGRWDWAQPISLFMWSSRAGRLVQFGVLSIVVANVWAYAIDPLKAAMGGEPFSLTLFPDLQRSHKIQDHRIASSVVLDRAVQQSIEQYVPNPAARRRNVFVIVGDALRADHMQSYGYSRPTTPFLTQLSVQGQSRQLQRVWSVCAQSSCGLMAILGSRYVHQTSHRSFTLLDVLKMHGYVTHMILGGDHTNFYGLREAYGAVDHYYDGSMASGRYMNDDRLVIEKLESLDEWDGKPVFMQFHLMSSHALGQRVLPPYFQPSESYYLKNQNLTASKSSDAKINFYDNGIRQFDDTVRQIMHLLQIKGYLSDSILVITGDHGEMLGEKGVFGHSQGVYEPVLRVPLIFIRYGHRSEQLTLVDRPGSQVDIAPTILADLGMSIPDVWAGQPFMDGYKHDFLYFQQYPMVGLIDVRTPDQLLKFYINSKTSTSHAHELIKDPDESHNMIERIDAALRGEWATRLMPGLNQVTNQIVTPESFISH